MAMRAAILRLFLFVVALSAGGCGISHNPSYFPYLNPPGDIIRTHAKPPGKGYFADFDPHAQSIVVCPEEGGQSCPRPGRAHRHDLRREGTAAPQSSC